MRLIDADNINWESVEEEYGARTPAVVACQSLIQNEPTIDPVRRGKWEYARDEVLDDLTFSAWKCSCCGYYAYKPELWHYCPKCGAKMEVECETD